MQNVVGDIHTIDNVDQEPYIYRNFQSMAGIYYPTTVNNITTSSFLSFDPEKDIPQTSASYCRLVPPGFSVVAASSGLILCSDTANNHSFRICDPIAETSRTIPTFPWLDFQTTPLALVLLNPYLTPNDLVIVCTSRIPENPPGRYYLDIFHTPTNAWYRSPTLIPMGYVIPNSGVSCGKKAYWRAECPLRVVEYQYVNNTAGCLHDLAIPAECSEEGALLQLGVQGDHTLYLVCVTQSHTRVYRLLGRQWVGVNIRNDTGGEIVFPHPEGMLPRPLRFESRFWFQAVFLVGADLVFVDEMVADDGALYEDDEPEYVVVRILALGVQVTLELAVPHVDRYLPPLVQNLAMFL